MKSRRIIVTIVFLVIFVNDTISSFQLDSNYFSLISKQILKLDDTFEGRYPEYTINGKYKYRNNVNWLSGFTGGGLWNLYDLTKNEELKERAMKHADSLLKYSSIDYTHDMGFIFLPTVIEAYTRTGQQKYRDAGIEAANMLLKRFNKSGNFLRAWGKLGTPQKAGLLIIDTMMNLELLFWAWRETGNVEFYDAAYKHAVICLEQNVRNNFSSYHVIEFNPLSGTVMKKFTHQGAKDESTWARGQAWGIYGFANAFKYTHDERFISVSKKMADYFISKLPADFVPYWDLDLKGDNIFRDASAGAIAASGMYILADLCEYKSDYLKYKSAAESLAKSVIDNYTFLNSKRDNEEGILIQTVYNYHKDWGVGESFTCGDFYFTEVLKKYINDKNDLKENNSSIRQKININDDWFYLQDNIDDINELHLTSERWRKVDLPHSWNKYDAVDSEPGYRRDASWYEKEINLEKIDRTKKYKILFEGSNITTDVYLNHEFAGSHIGGYIGFEIDISDFIVPGKNMLLVRVDNSVNQEIIPSQLSDFFIYGGISRDVWLEIVPNINITSVKISTPRVTRTFANTLIDLNINSDYYGIGVINYQLIDPNGQVVIEDKDEINLSTGANSISINLDELKNPILWSTETPSLYKFKIELLIKEKLIDQIIELFGYRWYEFKNNGAFYLNGERLLIRGTHRHEDHAGIANALSNEQHRTDIKMIKKMGANFIRLAHYPQDPEVYKACDELGILVWDELPWCRGGVGNENWKSNTKTMFKEIILQNYNHPSIIIWSVGNEIYWLPEREGGGNIDTLRKFTKQLHELAHELDPYRLTSIRKFYEGTDIVDVFSPSIWAGWYSGVYTNYETAIVDAQNKYPKFFHAEYGGSSHKGRHSETPITGEGFVNPNEWAEEINQVKVKNIAKLGDWSENYIVDLFDWHLRYSETSETLTGNAQWAFKDFGTPLRPENPIPYINQKGLVDREGKPKDAYYVFKSYWNSDDKFTYIESPSWEERIGQKGKDREISIYSNCSEVELYMNNMSLGKKQKNILKFPASGLTWNVNFNSGMNVLKSFGYEEGESVATDSLHVLYYYSQNEKPEKFNLSHHRLSNGNFLITAIAVDKNGRRCLDYNERVYFSSEGAGKLITNFGVSTRSEIIEMANGKAQIEFVPRPFRKTMIEIRNQNLKGNYLEINGF